MPLVSLLEPTVLMGVVEKLMAPESLTLLNKFSRAPWPYPTASWDIVRGSRMVAAPNVPNSEAHIVPRLGRSQQTAAFIYMRDKKVFEPTTLHWLRTPGDLAARNAEAEILREVNDLNVRFDNFVELSLWGALKGELHFSYRDVVTDVDYHMPASHKVTPGTGWDTANPSQIVADIRAWKRLITRDGRVAAREAFATENTLSLIFDAWTRTGNNGTALLLSDRMRDSYYSTGTIPGFLGLDWNLVESVYEDSTGAIDQFVPDNALFFGNYTDGQPIQIMEGPSADDDAPEGFTGRFMKTFKEPDPSARQIVLEYSFLPIVKRPEQFVYCADVTA